MNNSPQRKTVMSNSKDPNQDTKNYQHELLTETQAALIQEQNFDSNNNKQQPQQQQKKKKQKCRGNRKAQHLRRRIRHQQQKTNNTTNHMDHETTIIVDDNNNNSNDSKEEQEQIQTYSLNNQQEIRSVNKRKRQEFNNDNTDIHRSFSQLSISQENPKKKKTTTTATTTIRNNQSNNKLSKVVEDNHMQEMEHEQETNKILPENCIQKFKPKYLQVSDQIFKQMLSNAIQDAADDNIIQSLDTNEKLQFVRQMTELTNHLYYLDLQRQLWQDYYDINFKQTNNKWTLRLSKSDAKQLHTCHTTSFPQQHMIEKRQKTIQHQMQRTINELNQYLTQLNLLTNQWQTSIDPNLLSNTIHQCVKNGQQRLRQEFDYKRKMLELNSNDHHFIQQFYDLQPNEEQIHLAKMIWQTTANELQTKEYEEILRKRISLRRLPSTIDKIINQSIDPIQLLLANPMINKDRRASLISSCSKTITQYKFDLMILNLDTIQNIIRGHQQVLTDLQEKLLQSCNESMKEAIENRQQAMRKRHEIYLKHKLSTFFDEAPMAASNE